MCRILDRPVLVLSSFLRVVSGGRSVPGTGKVCPTSTPVLPSTRVWGAARPSPVLRPCRHRSPPACHPSSATSNKSKVPPCGIRGPLTGRGCGPGVSTEFWPRRSTITRFQRPGRLLGVTNVCGLAAAAQGGPPSSFHDGPGSRRGGWTTCTGRLSRGCKICCKAETFLPFRDIGEDLLRSSFAPSLPPALLQSLRLAGHVSGVVAVSVLLGRPPRAP